MCGQGAPFGSLGNRFVQKHPKLPGPASYNLDTLKATKQKAAKAVIGEAGKEIKIQTEGTVGPGSYNPH